MRLLITGVNYAPEETGIAPYTTGLAEHLVQRGHHVTVITGVPSYPQWRVYPEYRKVRLRREVRAGVELWRVRNYVPRRQSTLQRGLYEASFLMGGLAKLPAAKPDAVLGVVPSLSGGMLAWAAARRLNRPYGLILQDLIGPAVSQSGLGRSRASGPISAVEGRIARDASALGVIAEGFRPYLESLGVAKERIHRVRNWLHVEEPRLDRAAIRRRLGLPEGAVVCLHAGNMGYKQGLANLIECARLAAEVAPRLLFVLMGDGNQRAALQEQARRHHLPNLRFLPIQPWESFSSVLAAADVLLVNQHASVTDMSLPSKLTSYFASGRPIVAAVSPDSEALAEIRRAGAGVLVSPDQPGSLLEAINDLVDDPLRQEHLGARGRAYAQTELSAARILADLEGLIWGVMRAPYGIRRASRVASS
jgi:colanic acid biosynthesis glycosyl transferase WcaI